MQLLRSIIIALLTLIISLPVTATKHITCNASDSSQKGSAVSNLFSRQEKPFNSPVEYRQWVKRCMLSLDDYVRSRQSYFLIDIRDPESYSNDPVRQSLNIPVHLIKTKIFLKHKSVLLINEGYERVAVVHACKQLHDSGYSNVKILEEGVIGLRKHYNDNVGSNINERLFSITPAKLLFDRKFEPWVIVDLSTTYSKNITQYFDLVASLYSYPTIEQLEEILSSSPPNLTPVYPPSIILIDKDGQNFKRFELWYDQISEQLKGNLVVYLKGGMKAFDDYVMRQHAMLSKKEFVLTKPKGCAR